MKNEWSVIGFMSGTSLDGMDVALCHFVRDDKGHWDYDIKAAECYEYDNAWKHKLANAHRLSGVDLMVLHKAYGTYIGETVNSFIKTHHALPELITSHGHTVFHHPDKRLSFQLGDGAAIYAATGIPVVCDFRSVDVCLGGQGAPLVPVGDALLFKEYDYCLNLGGIANISFDIDGARIAYDICGCNLLLNKVINEIGLDFDDNGQLAKNGKTQQNLLDALDNWAYYKTLPPKSLDKETMLNELMPIIHSYNISIEDKLATINEHIATQISNAIQKESGSILVTGGGALNSTLVDKIRSRINLEVIVPSLELIEFKEALVFAFLGLLRVLNTTNTLASVTGTHRDSIGGALYGDYGANAG